MQNRDMHYLLGGAVVALPLLTLGLLIYYKRDYRLIAGYNTASPEEKAKYDIEGLADHLGGGLNTIAVCILLASVALAAGWEKTGYTFIGLFIFLSAIVVIGGQKFCPQPSGPRLSFAQRFIKFFVSAAVFASMERGTRQWQYVCSCSGTEDYWDSGGIRWKAVGNRREWSPCPNCKKTTWRSVQRRKSESGEANQE